MSVQSRTNGDANKHTQDIYRDRLFPSTAPWLPPEPEDSFRHFGSPHRLVKWMRYEYSSMAAAERMPPLMQMAHTMHWRSAPLLRALRWMQN